MVVIHSSCESTVVSEHSLDLRGMRELEFLVDVTTMFDWPPLVDFLVNRGSVSPELGTGFDLPEQEISGMMLLHRRAHDDVVGQIPGAFLLGHDQSHILEVCFV